MKRLTGGRIGGQYEHGHGSRASFHRYIACFQSVDVQAGRVCARAADKGLVARTCLAQQCSLVDAITQGRDILEPDTVAGGGANIHLVSMQSDAKTQSHAIGVADRAAQQPECRGHRLRGVLRTREARRVENFHPVTAHIDHEAVAVVDDGKHALVKSVQ